MVGVMLVIKKGGIEGGSSGRERTKVGKVCACMFALLLVMEEEGGTGGERGGGKGGGGENGPLNVGEPLLLPALIRCAKPPGKG